MAVGSVGLEKWRKREISLAKRQFLSNVLDTLIVGFQRFVSLADVKHLSSYCNIITVMETWDKQMSACGFYYFRFNTIHISVLNSQE